MRLGFFGGSFDPVHNGHLALAEHAASSLRLDQVWLAPAALQPHKLGGPVASDADRLAMLRLATEERPLLRPSAVEIERGGVSYTVETLRTLHERLPGAALMLLMGADTLRDLPAWREPEAVLRLATPAVAARAGEAPDFSCLTPLASPDQVAAIAAAAFPMPALSVSSTEVRRRLSAGESIAGLTPPAVIDFVESHGLYGSRGGCGNR